MRKFFTGVAVATLATAGMGGMSGTAHAIPDNKEPEVWLCDGVDTEIFAGGRSA